MIHSPPCATGLAPAGLRCCDLCSILIHLDLGQQTRPQRRSVSGPPPSGVNDKEVWKDWRMTPDSKSPWLQEWLKYCHLSYLVLKSTKIVWSFLRFQNDPISTREIHNDIEEIPPNKRIHVKTRRGLSVKLSPAQPLRLLVIKSGGSSIS